jgi:hypothetical protein
VANPPGSIALEDGLLGLGIQFRVEPDAGFRHLLPEGRSVDDWSQNPRCAMLRGAAEGS